MDKVEIIKIAEIFRTTNTPHIMYEETPRTKLYVKKLIDFVNENYTNYKAIKSMGVIRQPHMNYLKRTILTGVPDGDPIIGKPFTLNNSSWHTSVVTDIISDELIITKNSVYLLYNKSMDRDNKLKELGI
jgi:hypothetical protein